MEFASGQIAENVSKSAGGIVRVLRKSKGLSQQELGAIAGLSKNQISNIERGASDMGLATFIRLANGLQIQPHKALRFAIDIIEQSNYLHS